MFTLEEIITPIKTLWNFDYDPHVKALRDLYELAKKQQWNAATDIPWHIETDPTRIGSILVGGSDPLADLEVINALPDDKKIELAKRRSAWMLSQLLHGEQGAMLCAAQLVEAVPDMDGKFYASTQVIDEARHVEVFAQYIKRLDRVYPMMPGLKALLNAVLEADMWQMKCVGMQVIAESLALGTFKNIKETTGDEVLREITTLTGQDEARHVSYGLIYMTEELTRMPEDERNTIEDFAIAGLKLLTPNQAQGAGPMFEIFSDVGIDIEDLRREMQEKFADPAARPPQPSTFRDFLAPNLQRIGLITERTVDQYRELGLEIEV
ncbi:MAG: ferritin-like domain-containing protein [Acidobacteriota bacterium]